MTTRRAAAVLVFAPLFVLVAACGSGGITAPEPIEAAKTEVAPPPPPPPTERGGTYIGSGG